MKSERELIQMIHQELVAHLEEIIHHEKQYPPFNNILGRFPTTLAYLLQSILANYFPEFDRGIWMDDCLINQIFIKNRKLAFFGAMIWGRGHVTEQWTEPVSFETELFPKAETLQQFVICFGDQDKPEITYEKYRNKRHYWTHGKRNWKYVIRSKELDLE